MAAPNDLPVRKAMLAAVAADIADRTDAFEDSIADLRQQHERLRREYADALRTELSKVDVPAERKPQHIGGILAAIEKTQQPIVVQRLRDLAGRYIPPGQHRGP